MLTTATPTAFTVTFNAPGYLPETEPATFSDPWAALGYVVDHCERAAEGAAAIDDDETAAELTAWDRVIADVRDVASAIDGTEDGPGYVFDMPDGYVADVTAHRGAALDSLLADVVLDDHYCENTDTCDIARALDDGYPLLAAELLMSATECDATHDVAAAYGDTWRERVDAERAAWLASPTWTDHAHECDACGGITFGSPSWEPDTCGQCGETYPAPAVDGDLSLLLETGNAAMRTAEDIADALRSLADDVANGETSGIVRDVNGNTVGRWAIG